MLIFVSQRLYDKQVEVLVISVEHRTICPIVGIALLLVTSLISKYLIANICCVRTFFSLQAPTLIQKLPMALF